ncbi:hypothetical protein ACLOJK_013337 [Asimina triloba]
MAVPGLHKTDSLDHLVQLSVLLPISAIHKIPLTALTPFPTGLALSIEKKSRRMEISLYCFARAIESFFTCIVDAGCLPQSKKIKRADVAIFSLSTAIIMHCYAQERDVFRSKYLNVLDWVFGLIYRWGPADYCDRENERVDGVFTQAHQMQLSALRCIRLRAAALGAHACQDNMTMAESPSTCTTHKSISTVWLSYNGTLWTVHLKKHVQPFLNDFDRIRLLIPIRQQRSKRLKAKDHKIMWKPDPKNCNEEKSGAPNPTFQLTNGPSDSLPLALNYWQFGMALTGLPTECK